MKLDAALALFLVVAATGCGGETAEPGPDGGTLSPDGAGDPSETLEERRLFDRGSDDSSTLDQLLRMSDGIFAFDPTIDPAVPPEQNARNIESEVGANLTGCGTVTATGAMVTIDLGPPPGCTLKGIQVSGSLTLALVASGGTTTITLTLSSFAVGGDAVSGTLTFATTNGSTFAVVADLTSGTRTTHANLTVTGVAGAFTASGNASSGSGDNASQLVFNELHYTLGACYPDGGTLRIEQGLTRLTVTFTAATAESGAVTVTQGRKTYQKTLPAYGSCPRTDAGA